MDTNSYLKPIKNWIKENFFPLYFYLYRLPKSYLKFSEERKLELGKDFSFGEKKSILFFTVHRSASSYLGSLLQEIASEMDYVHANFDSYFANKQVPVNKAFEDKSFLEKAFNDRGYIYGPMRSIRKIPELGHYKILLVLRDPRDVLTSYYFAVKYSHGVLSKSFIEERKRARDLTIDQFVLDNVERFKKKYREYSHLYREQDVKFFKFESIMSEPAKFLDGLESLLETDIPPYIRSRVINEDLVRPERENKYKHKRSAKAGDFREKLAEDTIEKLNREFETSIETFNFRN